jgi:diguanylate cyclase (GGDEF)-like protein
VGAIIGAGLLVSGFHAWRLRRERRRVGELERLLEERTRQVRALSLRDPVTGLRNRRFVVELMAHGGPPSRAPRQAERRPPAPGSIGLFLVEIDGLAALNERYGRASGDLALKQVAAVVQRSVRREDSVARWDGAAVLVVARHPAPEDLVIVAERLRREVAGATIELGAGQSAHLTGSVGYAAYPFQERHLAEVLGWEVIAAFCGHALRSAHAAGGDRSLFVQPGRALPVGGELAALLADPAAAAASGLVVLADTTGWQVAARGGVRSA